jgi:ribosomal protein L7/L12
VDKVSSDSEVSALKARIARLEARLEYLYKHFNLDYLGQATLQEAEVIELIRQGKQIEAIKRYREIHNVGLADAKNAVDDIRSRLGL